ncbi:MAG: hypothetical protein WCH01_22620 [Methylococcaceae bacterium]
MSTLTADQVINLWRAHEQIRKAFKTMGAFQDYQLNPSESRYSVTLTPTGKVSVVENPAPQNRHKFL